jgi:hypothetical protein
VLLLFLFLFHLKLLIEAGSLMKSLSIPSARIILTGLDTFG